MNIFYCPCDCELDCAFYNPWTGQCEMYNPANNCDAALYAIEKTNED